MKDTKKGLPCFWSFNRLRDVSLIKTEDIIWRGPFSWPGYEQVNKIKVVPDIAGVYLFTFEYKGGFILRLVGVTNSMKRRFQEHTREYVKGRYTVLDVDSAKNGIRKELWHGWQYARDHQKQFFSYKNRIMELVEKELRAYRIFITQVDNRRKRERIEAALLIDIYSSTERWADLFDGGMSFRRRYNYEMPIRVRSICRCKLYGLPETVEI